MLMAALIVFAFFLAASTLPFIYPGAVVSALGVVVNHWLGEFVAGTLGVGRGTLVAPGPYPMLTFEGVLVVYLSVLVLILLVFRNR